MIEENKLILDYFCDNYNLSPIEEIQHFARYIDDYMEDKCKYCWYITCSEYNDCYDGIFEYLKSIYLK